MKTALLSFAAALTLLATTQSFAAPTLSHDNDRDNRRERNYKEDRRVAAERARIEAARRKIEIERERREAAERARREAQRRKDRDRDFNYGYDRNHRVTPAERARWEAAHRNDYGRR